MSTPKKSKSSSGDETFVSIHSGATFPVSERIMVVDAGPIGASEIDGVNFAAAADNLQCYRVSAMRIGINRSGEACLVSPNCDWQVDPDGRRIHSEVARSIYVKTVGYRWRRTRSVAFVNDTRAYKDSYDLEWYWEPVWPYRVLPDYARVSTYNIHHNFSACRDCGQLFPNDSLEDGLCPSCFERRAERDEDGDEDEDSFEDLSDGAGRISSYGTRAYPPERVTVRLINGLNKRLSEVLLGVELEVEVSSGEDRARRAAAVARACHDKDGRFVILKEDGSLNYGFEIVSAPMDLPHHKTSWGPMFDAIEQGTIKGLKAWTTTTAGMHVHVSREPLSCLQVGKVVVFVNLPANKTFMTDIAGRDSNTYTKFVAATKLVTGHRGYGGDRYCSVNLCGSQTIEFRLFKSTLNRARFQSNIQFCHAIVHYCAPCARSVAESSSYASFASWVRVHRKTYPDLDSLLVRKGYLPAVKIGKTTTAALVDDASN